ncbi:MAG: catalase, partial [Marinomonas sp.]
GKRYITDGEVQIDVSPIANDPQATIEKMKQVYRAALAPAEPSAADRSVASEAQQQIAEATAELAQPSQSDETNGTYQSSINRSTLEINSFYSQTNSTRGAQINLTA